MVNFTELKQKSIETINNTSSWITGTGTLNQMIFAILVFIIVAILMNLIMNIFHTLRDKKSQSPWLYKNGETKDAKTAVQVTQHSKTHNNIMINRSNNQVDGIEFTYVFWMYINDWNYKLGKWKHVLHKGNSDSWPGRAPGIWLHPEENKMRVYMNTFNSIADSYIDIDNIPLDKWFHVSVSLKSKYLDVYINGNLKKRIVLDGVPKQNNGDVYINKFGGFSGYMSCIRYYDHSISPIELEYIVKQGPKPLEINHNQTPPYLSTNWWINNY